MDASTSPAPLRARVRAGMRHSQNWLELLRFGAVGASGYAVNLVTYAVLLHGPGMDYRLAATGAFLVAVTNNFLLNRRWTFHASDGARRAQAARFLTISVAAFVCSLGVLTLLVDRVGVDEVLAQAAAIITVMPLSFLSNKLWSFAR